MKNFLYVGGNEIYSKIGITNDPLQRIKSLRREHGLTFNFSALYGFYYGDIAPALEVLAKHKFGHLTEFGSMEVFDCACETLIEWIESIIGEQLNGHELRRFY